jgi:hypothetical protein
MYFSKSTNGFYTEEIHGARRLTLVDPAWMRPLVDGEPDFEAMPTTIEIVNPHTKIPVDAEEISVEEHEALMAGQSQGKWLSANTAGKPILVNPPSPTLEDAEATLSQVLDNALNAAARAQGYDSILSACSYAAQPAGAPFQAQGAAYMAWRSATYAQAYAYIDQVKKGKKPMPTSEDEVLALMPKLVLPT